MTHEARFDVVIPCYNYGRYVADAVKSVLDQDLDVRVLVIDDCSQDNSAEICRELAAGDPRVEFRAHDVNRGHIATYNEGIEWASGDYFLLLSADDFVMPGAFRRVADTFAAEPRLTMVHGRVLYFSDEIDGAEVRAGNVPVCKDDHPCRLLHAAAEMDRGGRPLAELDREAPEGFDILETPAFWEQNTTANRIHTASAVTRTALQKKMLYRPELRHSGDLEMWLRFAIHGPIGFVPRFQAAARMHRSNMSLAFDFAADLFQRTLALDFIEQDYGDMMDRDLLIHMRRSFAAEALRATTGQDPGRWHKDHARLVELAQTLDPGIKHRPAWLRYQIKLALGPTIWRQLRRFRSRMSATRSGA